MLTLRQKYDRLIEQIRTAREKTEELQHQLDDVTREHSFFKSREVELEKQLAEVGQEIDRAVALAAQVAPSNADPEQTPAATSSTQTPRRLPRSLRELIEAFPTEGSTGLQDLRRELGLSDGGVNARIQNAKKAGLVERVGWGQYALTDAGRAGRAAGTRKLHLISKEGG